MLLIFVIRKPKVDFLFHMAPAMAFSVHFAQVCPHHILPFRFGLGVVITGYILAAFKSFIMHAAMKIYSGFLSTRRKGHGMSKSYENKVPDTKGISYLDEDFTARWGCLNDLCLKCLIAL